MSKKLFALAVVVLNVVILVIGGLLCIQHQDNIREQGFEASLTASDISHINRVITHLQNSKRGDIILFRNGVTIMVWNPVVWDPVVWDSDRGNGYVYTMAFPRCAPARLFLSSKRKMLSIEEVVHKWDIDRWAPLAQKIFELE